jgi:rhodanese-related sulfurtransferase
MPVIQNISAEDAKKFLDGRRPRGFLLVDGRSQQMFDGGHIAGATLIDARQEDTGEKLELLLKKRTLMIYCSTNNRTNELIAMLQELGYRGKIFTLTGGINAWREAGFEIATN